MQSGLDTCTPGSLSSLAQALCTGWRTYCQDHSIACSRSLLTCPQAAHLQFMKPPALSTAAAAHLQTRQLTGGCLQRCAPAGCAGQGRACRAASGAAGGIRHPDGAPHLGPAAPQSCPQPACQPQGEASLLLGMFPRIQRELTCLLHTCLQDDESAGRFGHRLCASSQLGRRMRSGQMSIATDCSATCR